MAGEHVPTHRGSGRPGVLSPGEQQDVERALALGLGTIAQRLFAGDLVEREFWRQRLAGAYGLVAQRDQHVAALAHEATLEGLADVLGG